MEMQSIIIKLNYTNMTRPYSFNQNMHPLVKRIPHPVENDTFITITEKL